jgi:hypothetical protein
MTHCSFVLPVNSLSLPKSFRSDRLHRRPVPEIAFCEEKASLVEKFLVAVHELTGLQSEQTQAVIDGDVDFGRFDLLIHMAVERKEEAKYALMHHIEVHRCTEA